MDRQKFYKMMELKYTASLYIMLFESISFSCYFLDNHVMIDRIKAYLGK